MKFGNVIVTVEGSKDHPCRPVVFYIIILESDNQDFLFEDALFEIDRSGYTIEKVGAIHQHVLTGFHLTPGYDHSFAFDSESKGFGFKANRKIRILGQHHPHVFKPGKGHNAQRIAKVITEIKREIPVNVIPADPETYLV